MCIVYVVWALFCFAAGMLACRTVYLAKLLFLNLSPLCYTSLVHLCLHFLCKTNSKALLPTPKGKKNPINSSFRKGFINILFSEALLPSKNITSVFLSPKVEALLLYSSIGNNRDTLDISHLQISALSHFSSFYVENEQ